MTGRWGSAPKRSSQHLAGDTFHFDREQLNPSTVGPREEKWRANKAHEEKQQSIQQPGPRMTRGPRLKESSRWHIRPQRSLFLASLPENDAGRGNVSQESNKNRCEPDVALILL